MEGDPGTIPSRQSEGMRASSAMMVLLLAARVRARSSPRPFLSFLELAVPVVPSSLVRTRSVSGTTPLSLMLVVLQPQPLPQHRVIRASSAMMVLPLGSFLRRLAMSPTVQPRRRSRKKGVGMVGSAVGAKSVEVPASARMVDDELATLNSQE